MGNTKNGPNLRHRKEGVLERLRAQLLLGKKLVTQDKTTLEEDLTDADKLRIKSEIKTLENKLKF